MCVNIDLEKDSRWVETHQCCCCCYCVGKRRERGKKEEEEEGKKKYIYPIWIYRQGKGSGRYHFVGSLENQ
jgi:hypothetical protein